jgi:hypothetical protein
MDEKQEEPERQDRTVNVPTPNMVAEAMPVTVTIENRVDKLEHIVEVLEKHDKRDRSQFWVVVLLALIAIVLSIAAIAHL